MHREIYLGSNRNLTVEAARRRFLDFRLNQPPRVGLADIRIITRHGELKLLGDEIVETTAKVHVGIDR